MEGTIGQILFFAGNFAPKSWAFCSGQILSIASNTALFSILGITYGGNGTSTFGLPNFVGRVPIGVGNGPGLSPISLGEAGGSASVSLSANQMPAHTHNTTVSLKVSGSNANSESPADNIFGTPTNVNAFGSSANDSAAGTSISLGIAGSNQPFSIIQPLLCVNFVICQYGVFPARN